MPTKKTITLTLNTLDEAIRQYVKKYMSDSEIVNITHVIECQSAHLGKGTIDYTYVVKPELTHIEVEVVE